VAVDESTWARLAGTPAGAAVDTVLAPDGTVLAPDGTVLAPDGTVLGPDGTVLGPEGTVLTAEGTVLDVRAGASVEDPDDRLADLVGALLVAGLAAEPAPWPGVVLTDDPVEARRVLTVIAALRLEHEGAGS